MNEYVTPYDLKAYCGIRDEDGNVESSVTGDMLILRFCQRASRLFDRWTRRHYYPLMATRYYDHAESRSVRLDADLLAVTTFTTSNTGTTVTAAQYHLIPYNEYPKYRVDIVTSSGVTLSYSGTLQQADAITGTWGYHTDWANAWLDSGDDLAAAISSATATTFTVANADGADVYGRTPRFKERQLLKIDSEYLYLSGINEQTNTLTVVRGVNGSTAATHDNASDVYVYEPEEAISGAISRWATYLYRQKDKTEMDTQAFPEIGMVTTPAGLPADVREVIEAHKRRRLRS